MKLFNITDAQYKSLMLKGIDLSIVLLLERAIEGIDLYSFRLSRIDGYIRTLERKGYIKDGRITEEGTSLYNSLLEGTAEVVLKKMENKNKEWEEFLSYYPPNNTFIWKGRSFQGDRGIKNNTKKGKELFTQLLNAGMSGEELWKAVVAESIRKMEESYKTGENKMKYFKNTETYLNQQAYMNFLDEGKELSAEEIASYREAYNRNRKKTIITKKSVDI